MACGAPVVWPSRHTYNIYARARRTAASLHDALFEVFGEVGEAFDPAIHNAVMHVEDDSLEENSIVEVFQKGFRLGDKVVRFAMVKVAN